MEGDLQHRPLLKYVMTEKTLANTLVVLTASMAQPWNIIESLNEWSEVLETHINRLRLLPEDLQEYKASCKSEPMLLITTYFELCGLREKGKISFHFFFMLFNKLYIKLHFFRKFHENLLRHLLCIRQSHLNRNAICLMLCLALSTLFMSYLLHSLPPLLLSCQ